MEYRFAGRMSSFCSSAVRDILKWTQGRDIISFAGGLPAEEFFPTHELQDAFTRIFQGSPRALQYGLTEGYLPLRELLSHRMKAKGITASTDEMILTTGSQQTLDLAARIFLEQGDVVLTENPTYLAALQVFQAAGAQVIGLPGDSEGLDLPALETALQTRKPKLLYVIPTFANPTGKIWSLQRRKAVLELCDRYGVMILEDDPYGELRFEEDASMPSLMALSGATSNSPVLYTSTFSKTVVPALRTGWAIGDRRVMEQMAKAKQAADLHSSSMDQQALYQLMQTMDLDGHIGKLRTVYKERKDLMVQALRTSNSWSQASFIEPRGGMFLWLELPEGNDTMELFKLAIEEGVAFVPGTGFYTEAPSIRSLRLNFSHSTPDRIKLGMERLTRAYSHYTQSAAVVR